jgi:pimeloyl-ACP methyl ester carboxylesterase
MRKRNWLLRSVLVLCVLAAAGAATWLWLRPPLIEVDGRRVEARIRGVGGPAIVFESGFSGGWYLWWPAQAGADDYTRTLVYERAGLGRSEPATASATAEDIAQQLHAVLTGARIPPPYVLVGHSAGGLYVRVFAHRYPEEVAALVLVDPATEGAYRRLRALAPDDWSAVSSGLTGGLRTQWQGLDVSLEQAERAWPLPRVPTYLISANDTDGSWPLRSAEDMAVWREEHALLAARLPGAQVERIDGVNHLSILRSPRLGEVIADAWQRASGAKP